MTTAAQASGRARYLVEVAEQLWPPPARPTTTATDGSVLLGEFLLVPDARRPRLVLPVSARRAAAAVARRYAEPSSPARRARALAVSLAVSSPLAALVFRDRLRIELPRGVDHGAQDTIETMLGDVLGRHVVVGMHLTVPRANRKPVLQALTRDGTLLAVAKVATGDLTRSLVAAEERALRGLPRPTTAFTAPHVVDRRDWHGHDVLTLAALPVHRRRVPAGRGRLAAVAAEIAATSGVQRARLAGSRYAERLRARIEQLRDPVAQQLGHALDRILAEHGRQQVAFGAWHGDFTRHNLAVLADDVLVWDWERYDTGVPLGFDLVHHEAQQALGAGDVSGCVHRLTAQASELLAPLGLDHAEAAPVARLYLVEIAVRYVADRQDELGMLGSLLPRLVRTVAEL